MSLVSPDVKPRCTKITVKVINVGHFFAPIHKEHLLINVFLCFSSKFQVQYLKCSHYI